ncbi:hypothetical protein HGRIS_003027 [Hohenbuehelia grisea]|uniref:F-box domain-containing protein n=1 Tax=Hohenbuehelia grisea TaxID=104357 RepID=A0ABR3JNH2_9AGAR
MNRGPTDILARGDFATPRPLISSLPTKILSNIIVLACARLPHPQSLPITSAQHVTWQLGQVCSTWRAIVVNTPPLWHNITLEARRCFQHGARRDCAMFLAKEALRRSKNTPLKFTYNNHAGLDDDHIFAAIAPLLNRSKTLSFHGSSERSLATLATHGPFPMLQSLEIVTTMPFRAPLELLREAPKFQTLHLRGLPTSSLYIPWSQIQNLTIEVGGGTHPVSSLQDASNVISLILNGNSHFVRSTYALPPTSQFRLSNLHNLTISNCRFLLLIIAPNLHDLEWHTTMGSNLDRLPAHLRPGSYFLTFLSRSRCRLTILTIHMARLTEAELTAILDALPDLSSLSLLCPHHTTNVDSLFTELHRRGEALPHLRHLCVDNFNSHNPTILLNFLEVRAKARRWPLDRFEVACDMKVARSGLRRAAAQLEKLEGRMQCLSWSLGQGYLRCTYIRIDRL